MEWPHSASDPILPPYNIEFSARSESEPGRPTITDGIRGPRQRQNGALQRFVMFSVLYSPPGASATTTAE